MGMITLTEEEARAQGFWDDLPCQLEDWMYSGPDWEDYAPEDEGAAAEPPAAWGFLSEKAAGEGESKDTILEGSPASADLNLLYEELTGYQPEVRPLLAASNAAEYAVSAARLAQNGLCVRQGTGLVYYDQKEGCWRPDVGEKRIASYLYKLAERFIAFWENGGWGERGEGEAKPIPDDTKALIKRLGEPSFLLHGVKPLMMALLHRDADIFNADGYMLNCAGIAVDLRTGKQRPACKGDYFTMSTKFKPGDSGKAVRFRQFLLEVCGGDESKAAWVLRWFCRAAVGRTLDSIILNLEGGGGNGKSIIQGLFLGVYGGYGVVLPQELVIKGGGSGEAARAFHGLEGIRYGTLADCGGGTLRLSELKRLTGGDKITSRALYRESVTFTSAISLVIGSNTALRLTETGEAIQRRLKNVKFEWNGKPDPLLMEKLLAEGEAITAVIIEECGKYLAEKAAGGTGFPPCEAIERHARGHIEAQNPVKQFLLEHPELVTNRAACAAVWVMFQAFAKDFGLQYPLKREFNAGMEREGYRVAQIHGGHRYWKLADKGQ
jgi:putative DNA primase/helicase